MSSSASLASIDPDDKRYYTTEVPPQFISDFYISRSSLVPSGDFDPYGDEQELVGFEKGQPPKAIAPPPPNAQPNGPPAGGAPGFSPADFPDGGLRAWLVVAGGWSLMFISFGWINCIGVFQDYYQTHMLSNYSPSTIAWIPSLEAFMIFAGGPIVGKIIDSYGPFYLLIAGTFFHVFGLMMTSLSTQYYQFILAQGICSSMGACMLFYPAMTTVTTWFFKRRALALGVMASGSSVGGVIFPIMVNQLIPKLGFPWTMRIGAFMILGLGTTGILTVRSRFPPVKRPVVLKEFVVPLKEPVFTLLTFGCFLFFLGMFLPINFLILQASTVGMSRNLANYLIPIFNAASFLGRTLPGYAADKIGRFNVFVTLCFLSGILILGLWLPAKANLPIIFFAALYGFSSGAFVSLSPSAIAQISDVRKIGVRTGTFFAIISIAALFGSPIGGALVIDDKGAYKILQIYAGIMILGGATVLLIARMMLSGPRLVVKV